MVKLSSKYLDNRYQTVLISANSDFSFHLSLITGEPKILNVTQGVIGVDDGFNTKKANITSSKMNDTEILNATHSLAISSLNEKPNNMHGFYVVVLCGK